MLLTEQQLSRRKNIPFPQPQRMVKVRKGMGAIRQVLGERKRLHLKTLSMERSSDKTDSKDSNEQPQPAEFSGESIATPPPSPN